VQGRRWLLWLPAHPWLCLGLLQWRPLLVLVLDQLLEW
jgi:hypothetical protein